MRFSNGRNSICKVYILSKITESQILQYYTNISKVPCIINAPYRKDENPSVGIYSKDGSSIKYKDFALNECGSIFDLLAKMWNITYEDVILKIDKDLSKIQTIKSNVSIKVTYSKKNNKRKEGILECKIRDWQEYDIQYWEQYGIKQSWLQFADVYPVSHTIYYTDGNRHVFGCDKHAYAYVEHKENNTTLKIYQPYNTKGFKWRNKHDSSVISLWTKIPNKGKMLCICSSLKDALCLWGNVGIPSIAVQGEGYLMSETAINVLKDRYESIYILFDNDKAGRANSERLSRHTGFINLDMDNKHNAKDISDLYLALANKNEFKQIILEIFKKENNGIT